jgi:hypothetical protein
MRSSSFDIQQIMSSSNRAIGHTSTAPSIPVAVPMRAAGGLYASANDMARYLQFHINRGMVNGRRVLDERLLDSMYTVPSRAALEGDQYALGIGFQNKHNTYLMNHGGGGFGFLCDMFWYPKLKIGMVLLTNSADHGLQGKLAQQILDEFIGVPNSPYAARAAQLDTFDPAGRARLDPTRPMSDDDLAALIRKLAPIPTEQDKLRWATYVGTYELRQWGQPFVSAMLTERDNQLYLSLQGMEVKLTEVRPGLLFLDNGEAFDLRGPILIAQGIRLAKIEGAPLLAQPQATKMPDLAPIDAYVESEMGAARIPGLGLAIVLAVLALQMFGLVRSVVLLRRWRTQPQQRPRGWRGLIWHIALPLALNLVVAALMLGAFPWLFGISLPMMLLEQPDLAWLMVVSGLFALGWGATRAGLSCWILRRIERAALSSATTLRLSRLKRPHSQQRAEDV